jgi:bifunctional non-homologous end joining protein LigD
MLAVLTDLPDNQDDYAFEYKWDGVRALCYCNGDQLSLESRNLLDITNQYPELQGLRDQLKASSAVLDGEIVAFTDQGRVSFLRLSNRMHVVDPGRVAERQGLYPVTYMLFDVLYLDGQSLQDRPYTERRKILERLKLDGAHWRTPPSHPGDGDAMLQAAREQRLEGVMAKRLDGLYEAGRRTGAWRKIKLVGRQEFVIGGWVPLKGTDESRVGALLIGYYDDPADARAPLRYAGAVGSGFDDADRLDLARLLKKHATDQSPFSFPISKPGARFVRPKLVAEIEYRGWGPSGALRQPSYKGLRTDKPPREVIREDRRFA